jgi:Protein of unknown function (DUF1073)
MAQDVSITASANIGSSLTSILECDDIEPGSVPSYELCKTIFVAHPLGQKMAEAPLTVAQSQDRKVTIQDSPPEVLKSYLDEWALQHCNQKIKNTGVLARVYGASAVVMGCKEVPSDKPIEMEELWKQTLFFNVLDPLNVAGSLVLSQITTDSTFQQPNNVTTNGQTFHGSRCRVMMNEQPIYIEYTMSAYGYTGRSVYQRALYALKIFIASMRADGTILEKLGVFIYKQTAGSSIIDSMSNAWNGFKRMFIRQAHTGNVISIDEKETIETLNMQNVDGAGNYARTNTLKNIATAADMPAKLLENETMVSGFGEGTEDAKNNARYIDTIRQWLQPLYEWFDNIVQYRAWNPDFFKRMQVLYPDRYAGKDYQAVFSEWRQNFEAVWPSLLTEPPSEQVKTEEVKLEACIATVQTFAPMLDPENKVRLIETALANISENKQMFEHEFSLDYDALRTFLEDQVEQAKQMALAGQQGDEDDKSVATKFGRFDSMEGLRRAVAKLPPSRREMEQQRRLTAAS